MTAVKKALLETQSDDTRAEFICALALVWPDGQTVSVEGKVQGALKFPARGTRGFGYDPIFQPYGHNISFGRWIPISSMPSATVLMRLQKLILRCFIPNKDG